MRIRARRASWMWVDRGTARVAAVLCGLLASAAAIAAPAPCTPQETFDDCIERLAAQMTVEEKASFLSGLDLWRTQPVPRLEIPSIRLADGSHGLRVPDAGAGSLPATSFPTASALAATWDAALLERVGEALGAEAQALGVQVLLGPAVDLQRSPLGGRSFESLSEDPVLAGTLAAGLVRGIESQGVVATLRHFVANNQETGRFTHSADIAPRPLHELYLRAFEIALAEGRPRAVMAAYHRVNDVPMTEHATLLDEVLRGDFGFGGVVVSDWLAVDDPAAAHGAGLDLRMPGTGPFQDRQVAAALRAGTLAADRVDASVRRLLRLVLETHAARREVQVAAEPHHDLAREAARRSIVLLRNAGGVLPLRRPAAESETPLKIAVLGAWAETPRIQGEGSSRVQPTRLDVPLAEIERKAEATGAEVVFTMVYDADGTLPPDPASAAERLDEARRVAAWADVAIVFAGSPPSADTEGSDRTDLGLAPGHDEIIRAVAESADRVVVVLQNGGPVLMPWLIEVDAVVETWLGGQGMGRALADVLFGDAAPGGRLPTTFPRQVSDTSTHPFFPSSERQVTYGEDLLMGYRHYDTRAIEPLFPFGHGLTYGRFETTQLSIEGDVTTARGALVRCTVKNHGEVADSEVVQLYVRPLGGRLLRPDKVLADFQRVDLEPGASRRVQLRVEPRDVTVWDSTRGRFVLDASLVEVLVGSSSRLIHLRGELRVVEPPRGPAFDRYTLLADWLDDPKGAELMTPVIDGLVASFLPPDAAPERRAQLRGFFLTLPAIKLVALSQGALSLEQLDALVRQVNGTR